MNRSQRVVAVLAVLLLAGIPQALAVTDAEVEEARQELTEARAAADRVATRIEEAWARQYRLEADIARISEARDLAGARLRIAEADLQQAAIRLYIAAASGESLSMALATPPDDLVAGLQYLTISASEGEDAIDQFTIAQAELDRLAADLDGALAEQRQVAAELEDLASDVQQALVDAQARYDRLVRIQAEEEAARLAAATSTTTTTSPPTTTTTTPPTTTAATETTAPAETSTPETTTTTAAPTTTAPATTTTTTAPPSGAGACPVQGAVSFVDSWGAPRSGGRTHKGVDMIAARGTPIAAIYSGTIQRLSTSSLGGISIYLRSDAGDVYYYAHLDGYADGISQGMAVSEGQVIGYNGSTGNAPDYLPHLHFEYHPGGGSAVNPYPLVKSICG